MTSGDIAYLGPAGTNGHQAALKLFGSKEVEARGLACSGGNASVIEAVASGRARWGIAPIENTTGPVGETIGALREVWQGNRPVYACKSVFLPIRHQLLALPEAEIDHISTVKTHFEAWRQCRRNLGPMKLGFDSASSTAEGASIVAAMGDQTVAAIASEAAAEIYSLKVLLPNIHDTEGNRTRFLLFSREHNNLYPEEGVEYKTLVIFECPPQVPGSLWRVLGPPALSGVNISMQSSFQIDINEGGNSSYYFVAVLDGHQSLPKVSWSISGMRMQSSCFHILGSYPAN
ncbi:MAG: prephenate dehydratase domain-containing protein [Patescibacteria group bacterium]|jgi:prephenate dehydratase